MILECPVGYTEKIGGGDKGMLAGYRTTLDECRRDCDARTDCKSFRYGGDWCKLMRPLEPTCPSCKKSIWCTKGEF